MLEIIAIIGFVITVTGLVFALIRERKNSKAMGALQSQNEEILTMVAEFMESDERRLVLSKSPFETPIAVSREKGIVVNLPTKAKKGLLFTSYALYDKTDSDDDEDDGPTPVGVPVR